MESDKFFDAFSHRVRRHIVKVLFLNTTMSYTELMSTLRIIEKGKLSFHLGKREILLFQNEEKRYVLSPSVAKPPSSYQTLRAPLIPPPS